MPDPIVQIEGVGNVQFPEAMGQDAIGQAAHKLYTGAASKKISANPPSIAAPLNPIQGPSPTTGLAGVPGGSPNVQPASDKATAIAGAGIGAAGLGVAGLSGALTGVGRIALPIAASEAISGARHIPYVGKFIPPYSEFLPFIMGGGGKAAKAEAMEKEVTDSLAARPKANGPWRGETTGLPYQPNPRYTPPAEPIPSRPQLALPPAVGSELESIPVRTPSQAEALSSVANAGEARAASRFYKSTPGSLGKIATPKTLPESAPSSGLRGIPVKTPPQAENLGRIARPAGEDLALKRFEKSTPGNLGKIAKPEPTPSAKPVAAGPKKPSYVDHAFGKFVDKFDPKNAQHNEILHATYDDLASRANAAELEGRSDWAAKDFARSTLTHGKNASPVTQRVRAALLETK